MRGPTRPSAHPVPARMEHPGRARLRPNHRSTWINQPSCQGRALACIGSFSTPGGEGARRADEGAPACPAPKLPSWQHPSGRARLRPSRIREGEAPSEPSTALHDQPPARALAHVVSFSPKGGDGGQRPDEGGPPPFHPPHPLLQHTFRKGEAPSEPSTALHNQPPARALAHVVSFSPKGGEGGQRPDEGGPPPLHPPHPLLQHTFREGEAPSEPNPAGDELKTSHRRPPGKRVAQSTINQSKPTPFHTNPLAGFAAPPSGRF
jgi:hypothetical protein